MKTKGMGIALLSTAALLGSAVAQAELPWTYAEFGYSILDGVEDFETDAYDIKGSIAFAQKWHASLNYVDGTSESGSSPDDDFDGYRLIVGAHPQLTPNTQLVTDLTYFDIDIDGGEGFDASIDGLGVGFGVRHSLTEKFELMGEVWYVQGNVDVDGFGDSDYNDTTIEFGGRYNWTPNLSTGLTINLDGIAGVTSDIASGEDSARFDVRWSFADVL